jgi:alpha-tubulin suppressor-like RCC1 family protein
MAVNESNTIQYTVTTSRVTDGTTLYWKTTGNTTNSDIVGGNTGTITVTNNQAFINVTIASDANTDGSKTLGLSLLTGSLNGTTVTSTANLIVINDTSLTLPSYRLYLVGSNSTGQLGLNDLVYRSSPVQVGSGTDWSTISHSYASAGIKSNGTLWLWGAANYGQLGNSNIVYRSSPVQVGALTNWSKVFVGNTIIATKMDGTLWAWGRGNVGQIGNNTRVNRSSPVQVGTDTNWSQASTAFSIVSAIKTDGTLWTWGNVNTGQSGLNISGAIYRSSPVQVGTDTNWSMIKFQGYATALAIKTDGTLWSWGRGLLGDTGLNNRIDRSSPVQVGSGTTWSQISSMGGGAAAAIKTDGTLWTWGQNSNGRLGLNDRVYRSSPTQVGSETTWSKLSESGIGGASAAIKTDGTLWLWGGNNYGIQGTNDRVERSSPTQVGSGTTWFKVSTSYRVTSLISQ